MGLSQAYLGYIMFLVIIFLVNAVDSRRLDNQTVQVSCTPFSLYGFHSGRRKDSAVYPS